MKRRLDGTEARFDCDPLVVDTGRRAVIGYVLERAWEVPGVMLRPGMVTYGHFWTDRDYNAYHWLDGGRTVGVYFNIGPCETITAERVVWTDYVVDVLATPDGRLRVLDEDELDDATPADVRRVVERTRALILADSVRLCDEVESETRRFRR